MLKINELRASFKRKNFITGYGVYNKLLSHALGLATLVDSRDYKIRELSEQNAEYKGNIETLERRIAALEKKYNRAPVRDIKTGRFKKG